MQQATLVKGSQINPVVHRQAMEIAEELHRRQVFDELRMAGAGLYDLWLPETKSLPLVIQPQERILGIVYGRYKQTQLGGGVLKGRGALVATNHRIFLLDKKPLFVRCDEVSPQVISGVTYGRVGFIGTVNLHTRMGDISVRTFNQTCARLFVQAAEREIWRIRQTDGLMDYHV
jgi:hypothetical protein